MSKVWNFLSSISSFFRVKRNLYLSLLILISIGALTEFLILGLVRRTYIFYTARIGEPIVEDRMVRSSSSVETDIRRYIEEALLGPVSQRAILLLTRDSRLISLLYREGVVYANFSEESALPVEFSPEEGVFLGFLTLNEGLRRNFPSIQDVRFFIGGNEIFFNEFHAIFADYADNSIKTGQMELTN